jgi:Cys-rich protein (TIGR01571 family)
MPRDFESSLLDHCCCDFNVCCYTFPCASCAHGKVVGSLPDDSGAVCTGSAAPACIVYAAVVALVPSSSGLSYFAMPLLASNRRAAVRRALGMEAGDPLADFLAVCVCEPCALAQELQALENGAQRGRTKCTWNPFRQRGSPPVRRAASKCFRVCVRRPTLARAFRVRCCVAQEEEALRAGLRRHSGCTGCSARQREARHLAGSPSEEGSLRGGKAFCK